MMKKMLYCAWGAMLLSSCIKIGQVAQPTEQGTPVQIRSSVNKIVSKGVDVNNTNIGTAGNVIGLWAYRGTDQMPTGNDVTIAANARLTASVQARNVIWTLTAADDSPLELLWPGNGDKLSFFAYYPYSLPANGFTNAAPALANETAAPSFDFAVAPLVGDQVDLLAARNIPQGTGTVLLQMHHILSKVSFKARTSSDNYRVNITYIGIEHVFSKATYAFSTQSGNIFTTDIQNASWSGHNTPANYNFAMVSNPVVIVKQALPNDYQDVSSPTNALYLLPQDLKTIGTDTPYFVITYSIDNVNTGNVVLPARTIRIAINAPASSENGQLNTIWSAGVHVVYNLDFQEATSGAGSPVIFNVSVNPWAEDDFTFN